MTDTILKYIIIILSVLVIIYLWNNYKIKKRLKNYKQFLISNWGKSRNNTYFNFFSISQYFLNNHHKDKAYHIISKNTAEDLDLDAVFKFIDRTSSKIGQQYLYYKLRTIQSIESLNLFSTLVSIFQNKKALRLNSQLLLSKLNNNKSYELEVLINNKPIKKPSYLKYIYGLSTLSIILIITSFIKPVLSLFLIPIFSINIIFHYKNKQNVNYYIKAINELKKALKVSKKLLKYPDIQNHFKDTSFLAKISSLKLKSEFISFDNHIDGNPFFVLLWYMVELIKVQFNLSTILFYSFINDITKERESIEKMFVFIGEIDSAIAIASVKTGALTVCKPQFINEKELMVNNIHHPLIENCITNNLTLNNKSLLLTGSNMSGKTTFIRTVAVNSILAQTLHICFATSYKAPFLKVFSSIRITDDLLDETSYYLQEVLTIKKLINASKSTQPCLFVLDEIFKGTNTIERVAGGKAILSYLNKKQHFILVSTHDIELTDLLKNDNFDLYHFSENIKENELLFDHKLKKGKLKTRNALKILELYHYPMEIIMDAKITESNFMP